MSLSSSLYRRLRAALLRCGPFESDRALRAVFVDARISAWRDALPEADSPGGRVDAVIEALSRRQSSAGASALALLMQVLSERAAPGDACHGQLTALAQEVNGALSAAAAPSLADRDTSSREPPARPAAQVHGDGAISQGDGNALGAGAVQTGDVGGDVVTGTKTTGADRP
jgi:hypothetical protein